MTKTRRILLPVGAGLAGIGILAKLYLGLVSWAEGFQHAVDLSMNLAALAILSTDTGLTFSALSWSAPSGGHHISGVLQFPAVINNVHILDDASRLILTIQNVDAPERKFSWSLSE